MSRYYSDDYNSDGDEFEYNFNPFEAIWRMRQERERAEKDGDEPQYGKVVDDYIDSCYPKNKEDDKEETKN